MTNIKKRHRKRGIKMRAPFQILAVPYRFIENELYFCVFRRADSNVWQFVAGGGEDNENPIQAALREIKKETDVTAEKLTELKSVAFVPVEIVTETMRAHWDKNIFVIPEYSFAFECNADPTLSREHSEYKWLPYNDARKLLKWDSNKVAMYEAMCRLNSIKNCSTKTFVINGEITVNDNTTLEELCELFNKFQDENSLGFSGSIRDENR
mgnify:CR=1 FL=1